MYVHVIYMHVHVTHNCYNPDNIILNISMFRVSLKSFSRVLWQTTVHKWEIELYKDMVLRGNMVDRETATAGGRSHDGGDGDGCREGGERRREGRKRRAAGWKEEEEGEGGEKLPSSKRRKAGEYKASKLHIVYKPSCIMYQASH